jgi:nucleotide-binding universal stress UspA family protein
VNASVNDAIKQTMQEFNAQLLIVGAHGHGFFERMMLGSIALHQVVAEPHSVLVLRAP